MLQIQQFLNQAKNLQIFHLLEISILYDHHQIALVKLARNACKWTEQKKK